MPRFRLATLIVLLLHVRAACPAAPVSFTRDLAPILADKCLTCHEEKKAKGKYRVDTFELLSKAGSSDEPSLTSGKPDASSLYTRLVTHEEDDRMPQKDDPLPPAQISLFKQWIEQGAKFDGKDPKAPLSELLAQKKAPATLEKYPQPIPITALSFAPDGESFFTSGYYEVLQWNAADGKLLRRLPGAPERVLALALQSTGKLLAVAGGTPGRSGEVVILSREDGKVVQRLPVAKDTILAAAFSPDGSLLAVGGADSLIRLYRTSDWKLAWKAEAHADWVTFLAFAPDGQHLVSTSRDRTARTRIFSAANGEPGITFTNHGSAVTCATWDPEGKFVFTGAADGEVRRWEWNSEVDGSGRAKDKALKGGRQEVTRLVVAGPQLLTASADGRIRTYQLAKDDGPKELETFGRRVDALAVDAAGTRLVVAGQGGRLKVVQLSDNKILLERTAAPGW